MEYKSMTDLDIENGSFHPFILSLGAPTSVICDNAMGQKMEFFSAKAEMETWYRDLLMDALSLSNGQGQEVDEIFDFFISQQVERTFKEAGISTKTENTGVIERAVELGLQLNCDAMIESFKQTVAPEQYKDDEKIVDFYDNMRSLKQISHLKILESKVLYKYRDIIDREEDKGSISTISAIDASTTIAYLIVISPYAFECKKNLKSFCKELNEKLEKVDMNNANSVSEFLHHYMNFPLLLLENTIDEMTDSEEMPLDEVDAYCNTLYDSISSIVDINYNILEVMKKTQEQQRLISENGEMPYEKNENYIDPSIL